jgi:hypothetical protein
VVKNHKILGTQIAPNNKTNIVGKQLEKIEQEIPHDDLIIT